MYSAVCCSFVVVITQASLLIHNTFFSFATLQMVLIMSGNLAFLNWLTALPAVMCFDDAVLSVFFGAQEVQRAVNTEIKYRFVDCLLLVECSLCPLCACCG